MRIFIFLISIVLFQNLFSQNDTTTTKGEVIDGEIIIEKEKKIILPQVDKVFRKTEIKSFNSEALNLSFEIFQPSFDWPTYKSDVPFQAIDKRYPSANYQNYVKLGIGNYSSPLLEAGFFKQLGKLKLSSGLIHESFARGPVNREFSRSSDSKFDLSAKYEGKSFSITPYLLVSNQQYNFYGNTDRISTGFSSEAPDEVRYNKSLFGTVFKGTSNGFKYYVNAEVAGVSQKLEDGTLINKEPYLKALAGITMKIDTTFRVGLDLEGYSSSYQSGISYDRSLFTLKPWVGYYKNDLSLQAGFKVVSNETFSNQESGFYPFAKGEMKFNPDWSIYAEMDGGVDWNNLDQLISENQFLDDSLVINNQETTLGIQVGVHGKLIKNVNVNASISYSAIKYFPIYVPSSMESSRFTVLSSESTFDILDFKVGTAYSPNVASTFGIDLKYSLYGYTSVLIGGPWHLPDFELEAYSSYNWNQKFIFSASLISLVGLKSPPFSGLGLENLPAIFDLHIGVKYLITNRYSAFIDTSNLFNNEYERYLGYPVRGIAFKIGGKYRF